MSIPKQPDPITNTWYTGGYLRSLRENVVRVFAIVPIDQVFWEIIFGLQELSLWAENTRFYRRDSQEHR